MMRTESSRTRFQKYLVKARERRRGTQPPPQGGRSTKRHRSFSELLSQFFNLLEQHRGKLIAALGTLALATLLGLVPLYAPKIVVDNILDDKPLPGPLAEWLPAQDQPEKLLIVLVIATVVLTLVSVAVGLWGRWHATRISKRLQSDVRKDAFEHAARLPLHRVQELKAGGVAGILRDDAGAVGNLVFGMIYNPLRAIVQFSGTLVVLALIDWKLLLGGLTILPIVWLTHRTWIARIRPMFRDVR